MSDLLQALRRYRPEAHDPIARYVVPNRDTSFGTAHGFAELRSYEDFAAAIPLRGYAELEPWIDRSVAGEPNVITREEPLGFEITSGTSSANKKIPITPTFQRELAAALSLWMGAWHRRAPAVFDGPAYWSICPRLGSHGELGFDDDGAYFPDDVREALGRWLVVPGRFDFESTARALLATPNLRSVSVWSPVFFLKLDEALGESATWKQLWPDLEIVSCWADAGAAMWIPRVIERLGEPGLLEPKGLLATEGVTSIPVDGGNVLARGVHFHEFIDCDSGEVTRDPRGGHRYEVVLTTGSGLYRYRTGDVVESIGGEQVCFVGRAGDSSDLAGEKLDGAQVAAAFRKVKISGFVRIDGDGTRYEVWATSDPAGVLDALRENRHLATALDTGQIAPCEFRQLPENWQSRAVRFLAEQRGAREGDVKLPTLERGELASLWES